jgi:hypothetical protein
MPAARSSRPSPLQATVSGTRSESSGQTTDVLSRAAGSSEQQYTHLATSTSSERLLSNKSSASSLRRARGNDYSGRRQPDLPHGVGNRTVSCGP